MQLWGEGQNQDDRRDQYRQKLFWTTALAPHHPQPQAQEAREECEVLQIREHTNLGGHPPNQNDLGVQSDRADQE
jgi:hypothetical protein